MGGNNWATREQKDWLRAYYDEYYVPCLRLKDYTEFKPVFYMEWFKKWPKIESKEAASGFPPGTTKESLNKVQLDHLASRVARRQMVSYTTIYSSNVNGLHAFQ